MKFLLICIQLMNASNEKSNVSLDMILRIKEGSTDLVSDKRSRDYVSNRKSTDLVSDKRSSVLSDNRRSSVLSENRRSSDLANNRRSADLANNRRSGDLVYSRKPSELKIFFNPNKSQPTSKPRDYTSENFKKSSTNSFIRNELTRQNMKKIHPSNIKSEPSKKVIKSEQNIKTDEKYDSYNKSYMRVASLNGENANNVFVGNLLKDTDRPDSSIPIKIGRRSINSQSSSKNNTDKADSNEKTLYRFGKNNKEQYQMSTLKSLNKSATLEIKIENLKSIIEEFNNRLQDTFTKEEDDEWDIVKKNFINIKKLAVDALDTSVDGVRLYLDTLKIIDEVPSDRQYGNLIQLNEIFDRLCAYRDTFKKEINRLVLEMKPTLDFIDKLRVSEKNLVFVFDNMKKDLDLLKAWSADLKMTISFKENYSQDFEILVRVFECLYAIVSYEDIEIKNKKSKLRRIPKLRGIRDSRYLNGFVDVPYKFMYDMFSYDVDQFFIKQDNFKEEYWSQIRNFVAEIEKYTKILLFESNCTIKDFFNEINIAFFEISEKIGHKYKEIFDRIYSSQVIKALRDEILLIKVYERDESEIKTEVEALLHNVLDSYIRLE